jgi:hypothetical protein
MSDQTNVGVQSLTIREASMATANTEKFLAVSAASTDSTIVNTVLLCTS